MNSLTRFAAVAALCGVTALFTGCVQNTSRAPRVKVVEEFSVVESSTAKELTSEQLADLRKAVAAYLHEQGLTDGRTYFVRVSFPSENPDEQAQWAVVRISSHAARSYTVLAAYPGADDYYPYDLFRPSHGYSNYYNNFYPYAGFTSWGYYDPFDYNYGYYNRPVPPRDYGRPEDPKKPTDPVSTTPRQPGPRNRWDNPPTKNDDQPRGNHPRPRDSQTWKRENPEAPSTRTYSAPRADRNYTPRERSSPSSPERNYTPPTSSERSSPPPSQSYSPPAQSYSPPPAPSYSPPPSSDHSSRSTTPSSVQDPRQQER